MTNTTTGKQQALLRAVQKGAGRNGVYGLARRLKRPYRRVYDQVRLLEARGQLRTQKLRRRGRTCLAVMPLATAAESPKPNLQFNRAWSRPSGQISDSTLLAQVLARPTFRDLLACAVHYGPQTVRQQLNRMVQNFELPAAASSEALRMLGNIELGLARAAR